MRGNVFVGVFSAFARSFSLLIVLSRSCLLSSRFLARSFEDFVEVGILNLPSCFIFYLTPLVFRVLNAVKKYTPSAIHSTWISFARIDRKKGIVKPS